MKPGSLNGSAVFRYDRRKVLYHPAAVADLPATGDCRPMARRPGKRSLHDQEQPHQVDLDPINKLIGEIENVNPAPTSLGTDQDRQVF